MGGAIGSDTQWDIIGSEFGMINNKHYWTETKTPRGNTEISKQDFEEGRFESAKSAKRNFGYQYSTMKDSRLIRNWNQVKYSESVFAIGNIVKAGEKLFPNQKLDTRTAVNPSVTGGTGYAVGMAINNNKPVYVFNQTEGSYGIGWYKFDVNSNDFIKVETPILAQNFAGIGTRNINEAGKQAIREVYEKTIQQQVPLTTQSNVGTVEVVKPGVQELFESNPELANAIYEAFGFNDKEITIGKGSFDHDNYEGDIHPIRINGEYAGSFTITKRRGGDKLPIAKQGFISGSIGSYGIELESEFQGKGYGKRVYLQIAKELSKEGITLKSEFFGKDNIGDKANSVWQKLVNEGYAVDKGEYFEVVNPYTPQQKQQPFYSIYLHLKF